MNPYLDVLFRTVIAYFALVVLTRLTGRREINQLTFPDFASALAIGSVAGRLSYGEHSGTGVVVFALVVWIALTVGVDLISMKSRKLRVMFDGGPTTIIHNGKLLEDRLGKLRYSVDDVLSLMREKGVFNVRDVEFAVVEPSGKLSILRKSQHRPITPADLSIPTPYEGIAVTLVSDGQIRRQNLQITGLTREWLLGELQRRGLTPEDVVLAQLDTSGQLYLDLRADGPQSATPGEWVPPAPPRK